MRPVVVAVAVAAVVAVAVAGCSGELTTGNGGGGSGGPDGAASAATAFRPGIQQDLDAAGCIVAACHGGTVAPMPLIPNPVADDDWEANYNQVKARAGSSTSSLLIDKAVGAGAHVEAVTLADPMMDRWQEWIAAGAPYEASGPAADAGPDTPGADAGAMGIDASPSVTYEGQVRPLLDARGCLDCHGSAGAYSLESYSATLGFGTDGIPNVVPGDPTSLLIVYCEQGHYDMPAADTLTLISWIVDWNVAEL